MGRSSPDGRFISFVSGQPDLAGPRQRQIRSGYVWSRETGKLRLVPDPAFPSDTDFVFAVEFSRIAVSPDGATLAYQATFGLSNAAESVRAEGMFRAHRGGRCLWGGRIDVARLHHVRQWQWTGSPGP